MIPIQFDCVVLRHVVGQLNLELERSGVGSPMASAEAIERHFHVRQQYLFEIQRCGAGGFCTESKFGSCL